jgi:predicted RNA methylase
MKGATANMSIGLSEFADMMLALHFLRKGDLFVDVGANVGSYAVLASGVCRATTWAFEPDPNTVRSLKRNLAINNLNDLGVPRFEPASQNSASLENCFPVDAQHRFSES